MSATMSLATSVRRPEHRFVPENVADQLRDRADIGHLVAGDVEHAGAAVRLERPQDHAADVVDVDRVHAGTPIAVELDRLACLDPLGEAREHPPLLARAVGDEEPEDGDVQLLCVRQGDPLRRDLRRGVEVLRRER